MQVKEWQKIRETLRKRRIHPDQVKHINCIRIHNKESRRHFLKKAEICYNLFKQKHNFITEAWTEDRRKRFDILDLVNNVDIEIETGKSKSKKYKGDEEVYL